MSLGFTAAAFQLMASCLHQPLGSSKLHCFDHNEYGHCDVPRNLEMLLHGCVKQCASLERSFACRRRNGECANRWKSYKSGAPMLCSGLNRNCRRRVQQCTSRNAWPEGLRFEDENSSWTVALQGCLLLL